MAKGKHCSNCGGIVWFNEEDVDIFETDEYKSKSKIERVAYLYEHRLFGEMERRLLKNAMLKRCYIYQTFIIDKATLITIFKYLKIATDTQDPKALKLLGDHYTKCLDEEKAQFY